MGFFKNLFGGKKDDDYEPFVSDEMVEREDWSKDQWSDYIFDDFNNIHELDSDGQKCNQFDKNEILLLVIPLLFEAKFTDICTEIWLVKCPKEVQKKRLMKRNIISENEAEKIINLQLNFEDKSKFSDVILDNSDNKQLWKNTVQKLV